MADVIDPSVADVKDQVDLRVEPGPGDDRCYAWCVDHCSNPNIFLLVVL